MMTERTMNAVVKTAEREGWDGIRAYPRYSGRGMHGKTTCAIAYTDLGQLLAAVAYSVHDSGDGDALAEDLREVTLDSMGRGSIIY